MNLKELVAYYCLVYNNKQAYFDVIEQYAVSRTMENAEYFVSNAYVVNHH